MTQRLFWFLFPLFPLLVLPRIGFPQSASIDSQKSVQIVEQLLTRAIQNKEKLIEYAYIEDQQTDLISTKSNEVESVTNVSILKQISPGREDKTTILTFSKDGEELPVAEYEPGGEVKTHELLGPESTDYYSFRVTGTTTANKRELYIIAVTPKDDTEEYFAGTLYVDAENLELKRIEGETADTPFGVRSIHIAIDYLTIQGIALPSVSQIVTEIHVPIVFPNKKLIIFSQVRDHQVQLRSE